MNSPHRCDAVNEFDSFQFGGLCCRSARRAFRFVTTP
jgi:hypothetical protein